MTRPRRLYTTAEGKFYYLIDGKKKFVKAPAGVSQKQIAKINIKNIVNAPAAKRLKRRKKRIEPAYGKKVGGVLEKDLTGGLPLYFFKPKRNIPTLDDQAEASSDTTVDKLAKALLKGLKAEPTSSRIPATVETEFSLGKMDKKRTSFLDKVASAFVGKRKTNKEKPSELGGIKLDRTVSGLVEETSKVFTKPQKGVSTAPKEMVIKFAKNYYTEKKELPTRADINEYIMLESDGKNSDITVKEYNDVIQGIEESFGGDLGKDETDLPEDTKKSRFSKFYTRKGKGDGNDVDGLYNDEIEKIVKKRIKNYVPVIASDEINELPRYVARGDKRFGFVINTNPSTSDGSGNDGHRTGHWRSVYINNEDDYPTVEYFDPLSEGKMPPELIQMTRKIAMKMNPSMMFKYKQNMLRRQSKLTSSCGHHSIKFLDDRYNGVPYADATGYTDYMERMNSAADDSNDGEKDIAKTIKKYESYI